VALPISIRPVVEAMLLALLVSSCVFPYSGTAIQIASVTERAIPRKSFVSRGKTSAYTVHELVFAVKQRNLDVVESELLKRSTPGSPQYQQWLSHDDVGELVSNPTGALAVATWLTANGARVSWKSKYYEYIKATAPISIWENLLSTSFYGWEDLTQPAESRRLVHRAADYKLPSAIADHLTTVFRTVQTPPAWKQHSHMRQSSEEEWLTRAFGDRQSRPQPLSNGEVTVSFLNGLYKIPSNIGSSAQQQSVFETGGERYSSQDLQKFQQTFGLPLQAVAEDYGYDTDSCTKVDCFEGNLDVQYMMGVAQQTQMIYWYQGGDDPFIDWITEVADASDPPLVNSISWGSIEQVRHSPVCGLLISLACPSPVRAQFSDMLVLLISGVQSHVVTCDEPVVI
jgi:hypothetical protein